MSKNAFTAKLEDGRTVTLDESAGTLVVKAPDGTVIERQQDGPLGRFSKKGVGRRYDTITQKGKLVVG